MIVPHPSPLEGRGEGEGDDKGFQGIPPLNISVLLKLYLQVYYNYI